MDKTIVSVEKLREHLHDPGWVIVDARHSLADPAAGRAAYAEGHIPGAFFADLEEDLSGVKTGTNGRHPLPEREEFLAYLRSIGVNEDTQLVVYDAGADMFAARFWYLVRHVGKSAVAVLDGGFAAWVAAGLPTVATPPAAPRAGDVQMHDALDVVLDLPALDRASGHVLLDARAPERYRGEVEPVDPVAGRIPGARNRYFKDNYDERGFWKSGERLRSELSAHGAPERIIHYCGSGVSAAVNLLAYEIAMLRGPRIYPGGWSEWCCGGDRMPERD